VRFSNWWFWNSWLREIIKLIFPQQISSWINVVISESFVESSSFRKIKKKVRAINYSDLNLSHVCSCCVWILQFNDWNRTASEDCSKIKGRHFILSFSLSSISARVKERWQQIGEDKQRERDRERERERMKESEWMIQRMCVE
jgi:hypothetical protein